MDKEITILFKHLLDKIDPKWRDNEEIVDALRTISETKNKKFIPPTLKEVIIELRAQNIRNYVEQADKFWNFYESKNWMIGKNKMKNWKAAIKTWNFEKNSLTI